MIPARLEPPRWDAVPGDRERCLAGIDEWVRMLLDSELPAAFDPGWPAGIRGADAASALRALDAFAATHWDFRAGRERNLAEARELTPAQRAAIDSMAGPLGLDGTSPPRHRHYDAVLLTGGMVRAGIVKPRFLRELADAGLAFDEGVFLGAFRAFAGDEQELAPRLGVPGDDEVDAMREGMERAFGPLPHPVVESFEGPGPWESWRDERWGAGEGVLRVLAAPSSAPTERRANTADTFRFWARRHARPGARILVVTTPVYVPYQAAIAVEVLGLESGLAVETVAVSESANDLGELTQRFGTRQRLQELRSAVAGLRGLRERLAVGQPEGGARASE
jgi:hypothetical protein